MGGDRGPAEIVAGALEAASDTIVPVLFGAPGLERALDWYVARLSPERARKAGEPLTVGA